MKKLIEWVEIPTVDLTRAVQFYNTVFHMSMEALDFGSEKMAVFPTGEGALFYKEGFEPSEQGARVSFRVVDTIDETCTRIIENEGKVILPKTKIEVEGKGFFALVLDSEGNKIGLYE